MAIEAEDLIANTKSDLSQAIVLLLRRRSFYKDLKKVAKYRETNCQISQICEYPLGMFVTLIIFDYLILIILVAFKKAVWFV